MWGLGFRGFVEVGFRCLRVSLSAVFSAFWLRPLGFSASGGVTLDDCRVCWALGSGFWSLGLVVWFGRLPERETFQAGFRVQGQGSKGLIKKLLDCQFLALNPTPFKP